MDIDLGGGTLAVSGEAETIAGITLSANSVIDMAGGNSHLILTGNLNLAGFTLGIHNWSGALGGNGSDQLDVLGSVIAGGGNIVFYGDSGVTPWSAGYLHGSTNDINEVVPAPEASAWISGFAVFLYIVWHGRRRWQLHD